MAKEIILDIGIGSGGTYIEKDPPNVLRIGLDKDKWAMWLAKENYNIPCFLPNINSTSTHLPFTDKSITSVEIILPQNSLLLAMTNAQSNFWKEVKRITKRHVSIVVDTGPGGSQGVEDNKKETIIQDPDELIVQNLQTAGFTVKEFSRLAPDQLADFGTVCSVPLAGYLQAVFPSKAYKIVANCE